MEIRIGTRPSPLALKQVEEAVAILGKIYPGASYAIHKIFTAGDKDRVTPISEVEGSDFFTRELDESLLAGHIDFAVHSSKDLPDILPEGLIVAVETDSISRYDALVSKGNIKFAGLPAGRRIGASSSRRKSEIAALRKDLNIVNVRGNIEERIALVDLGKVDALVVAEAALIRLGLEHRSSEILPLELFKTHPKQGSISLVVREDKW